MVSTLRVRLGWASAIFLIAAIAVQPALAWSIPCACRGNVEEAAAPPVVEPDHAACCAQRNTQREIVQQQVAAARACLTTGQVHASGTCCCFEKAPPPTTVTPAVAADISLKPTAFALPAAVVELPIDGRPLAAALRFGSPAELAHASRPSVSILYGVWRN
ncbi:MAG: hypothetical protein QM775_20290 [Pirellulales bacterium]